MAKATNRASREIPGAVGRRKPLTALQLAFRASGMPEPETEYRFCPRRRWAFDYAWPLFGIALEVEGGLYGKGKPCPYCKRRAAAGHGSIERLLSDLDKYNAALLLGWRVIRVQPGQTGRTLDLVKQAILMAEGRPLNGALAANVLKLYPPATRKKRISRET